MRKTMVIGMVFVLIAVVFSVMLAEASPTFTTYDDDRSGFNAAISSLQSTELNFDELSDYAEVTDCYADMHVVFSALQVSDYWSGVHPDYPTARYGSGSLSGSNPVSYYIGVGVPWDSETYSELYVEFSYRTSFVGAYFIDNVASITVRIFDINDNQIGVFTISGTAESGDSGEWWGVVADESIIARMTFTATNKGDFFAIDNFVFQKDTTPPTLEYDTDDICLWPPNHKYHKIDLSDYLIEVSDICDPDVDEDDVVITSVSSDEPENAKGKGDGNTADDIVIVDSQTVKLRAERQGTGNGRVYTINFEVTDMSENTAEGCIKICIPHDKGGDPAIDDSASAGYTVYP